MSRRSGGWPSLAARAASAGERLPIIPRHPLGRIPRHLLGVSLELGQVVEWVDSVELASVDEAHKQVAHLGAVHGLVEEGVLPVEDRFFQRAFAQAVGEGRQLHRMTTMRRQFLKSTIPIIR